MYMDPALHATAYELGWVLMIAYTRRCRAQTEHMARSARHLLVVLTVNGRAVTQRHVVLCLLRHCSCARRWEVALGGSGESDCLRCCYVIDLRILPRKGNMTKSLPVMPLRGD